MMCVELSMVVLVVFSGNTTGFNRFMEDVNITMSVVNLKQGVTVILSLRTDVVGMLKCIFFLFPFIP